VPAEAVIYAGDLDRMRAFYAGCFALTAVESAKGYCCLQSDAWSITLVRSAAAVPSSTPPPRRAATPIKLGFEVADAAGLRPVIEALGGTPGAVNTEWSFRGTTRCDCLDPEGNVVQLIRPDRPGAETTPRSNEEKTPMDTPYAFVARLEAKPDKAGDLAELLKSAQALAEAESGTVAWYAAQTSATTFWIFDTFASQDARQAHIQGEIAKALMAKKDELLAADPEILPADVLAQK